MALSLQSTSISHRKEAEMLADQTAYPPVRELVSKQFLPDLITGLMAARQDQLHFHTFDELKVRLQVFVVQVLRDRERVLGEGLAAVAGYQAGLLGMSLEDIRRDARDS